MLLFSLTSIIINSFSSLQINEDKTKYMRVSLNVLPNHWIGSLSSRLCDNLNLIKYQTTRNGIAMGGGEGEPQKKCRFLERKQKQIIIIY